MIYDNVCTPSSQCNKLKFHLKQHISRFMLIFLKIFDMYLKVKNCEVTKKAICTLQTTPLTTHVNYQNEVIYGLKSLYCVSYAEEIRFKILKNQL
jgi:hypothetical protein